MADLSLVTRPRPRSSAAVLLAALAVLTLQWLPSPHSPEAGSFAGGVPRAAAGAPWYALDAASRHRGCTGREAVGLFFSTQTGHTERVAKRIANKAGIEAMDMGEVDDVEDLAGYDGLIVGSPTWNTGADQWRSGTAWDDLLEEISEVDLTGKPVTVFGLGDCTNYPLQFCDGIEELHDAFEAAGAKMIGYVDDSEYEYSNSKSVRDGKFLGLPLDEETEKHLTEDRIKAWIAQIKAEGMPL